MDLKTSALKPGRLVDFLIRRHFARDPDRPREDAPRLPRITAANLHIVPKADKARFQR